MKRTYARVMLGPLRVRRPDALPDRVLTREGVVVDRGHLAAYDRVCGFRLRDELPATYPHVLAFPLALELMAGPFPFSPLGVVHIGNRIEQDRPLSADERLDLRVYAEGLAEHPRGRQFDVVAEAATDGVTVWRSRSTYLHREGSGGGGSGRAEFEPPPLRAVWRMPGDVGRRYAAVSGDRNPIHLHPLAARVFGQKGTIAHGMWTKARCLAAFEGSLPGRFAIEARFKTPLPVPGRAGFGVRGDEFFVWDARSGRPVLGGRTSTPAG